ncbi:hypothetical protein V8D89_004240 [Ganoderma adspersum]
MPLLPCLVLRFSPALIFLPLGFQEGLGTISAVCISKDRWGVNFKREWEDEDESERLSEEGNLAQFAQKWKVENANEDGRERVHAGRRVVESWFSRVGPENQRDIVYEVALDFWSERRILGGNYRLSQDVNEESHLHCEDYGAIYAQACGPLYTIDPKQHNSHLRDHAPSSNFEQSSFSRLEWSLFPLPPERQYSPSLWDLNPTGTTVSSAATTSRMCFLSVAERVVSTGGCTSDIDGGEDIIEMTEMFCRGQVGQRLLRGWASKERCWRKVGGEERAKRRSRGSDGEDEDEDEELELEAKTIRGTSLHSPGHSKNARAAIKIFLPWSYSHMSLIGATTSLFTTSMIDVVEKKRARQVERTCVCQSLVTRFTNIRTILPPSRAPPATKSTGGQHSHVQDHCGHVTSISKEFLRERSLVTHDKAGGRTDRGQDVFCSERLGYYHWLYMSGTSPAFTFIPRFLAIGQPNDEVLVYRASNTLGVKASFRTRGGGKIKHINLDTPWAPSDSASINSTEYLMTFAIILNVGALGMSGCRSIGTGIDVMKLDRELDVSIVQGMRSIAGLWSGSGSGVKETGYREHIPNLCGGSCSMATRERMYAVCVLTLEHEAPPPPEHEPGDGGAGNERRGRGHGEKENTLCGHHDGREPRILANWCGDGEGMWSPRKIASHGWGSDWN